jgi:hypothetical protein
LCRTFLVRSHLARFDAGGKSSSGLGTLIVNKLGAMREVRLEQRVVRGAMRGDASSESQL